MHVIYGMLKMEDKTYKTKSVRSASEPDLDDPESVTNIILQDLVMNLAMSGETGSQSQLIDWKKETPHLVDEPLTDRNKLGLFDLEVKF